MIALEVLDALERAGCSAEQILAAIRAEEVRLSTRRMVRRALKAFAPVRALESGFVAVKPDSDVRISAPDGVRMAPVKAAARNGLVGSAKLRPAAKRVADRLLEHFNLNTGRCDPGIPRMARDLGLSIRSVRRAIAELEAAGLVQRYIHAGRGHSNGYRLNLVGMAGLASPLGAKPDSSENRTQESVKPDGRVRQNKSNKQSHFVGGDRRRARPPDPMQPQLLLPLTNRRAIAMAESAEGRVLDDIERVAKAMPSFNVSGLTKADWADVHAAETAIHGDGMRVVRERLATGPPLIRATG